jgi:hypothetical protein
MAQQAVRMTALRSQHPQGGRMTRTLRTTTLTLAFLLLLLGTSSAEKIVQINPGPGRYDQPSAIANGATVHVAFIGAPTEFDPYTVYYAAVNGGSDFTNMTLTKDSVGFMATPAVQVIDNAGITASPGDNVYYDARHPRIALQTAEKIVIFFQAKESIVSTGFSLYRAQITLTGNAPTGIRVNRISGVTAGDLQDVSFGVVASDNTARLVYSVRPSSLSPFDVEYARIALDNGSVIRTPIRLSTVPGSRGSRPVPNLRLDGANRAHVAWSADNLSTGTFADPAAIYYAMIKEFNPATVAFTDNAAIAATRVIHGYKRFSFPQVLVSSTSLIHVLASDEAGAGRPGSLALTNLNPEAALQDNASVNIGSNNNFLLNPPGEAFLPGVELYRPEAWLDLGGRIHMTGYGNGSAGPLYFAATPLTASPYLNFLSGPSIVGNGSDAVCFELPSDYTKASFAFIGGKGVVFWSGADNTATQSGTLNVTALPTINEWVNFNEKGCSAARGNRPGGAEAIVDLLMFALPLALLKFRSILKRG